MNHLSMRTKSHWLSSLAIVLCLLFNPLSMEKSMAAKASQAADAGTAADSSTVADSKKEKAAAKKAAKAKAKADKKKAAKKAEAKAKHEAMKASAEMQQAKADKKRAKQYSKKSKQEAQLAQDEAAQAKADAKKAKSSSGFSFGKLFGGGNSQPKQSTDQAAKKQTNGNLNQAQQAQKAVGYDGHCCINHGFIDLVKTDSVKNNTAYVVCKKPGGKSDCKKIAPHSGSHRKGLSGLLPFN